MVRGCLARSLAWFSFCILGTVNVVVAVAPWDERSPHAIVGVSKVVGYLVLFWGDCPAGAQGVCWGVASAMLSLCCAVLFFAVGIILIVPYVL